MHCAYRIGTVIQVNLGDGNTRAVEGCEVTNTALLRKNLGAPPLGAAPRPEMPTGAQDSAPKYYPPPSAAPAPAPIAEPEPAPADTKTARHQAGTVMRGAGGPARAVEGVQWVLVLYSNLI